MSTGSTKKSAKPAAPLNRFGGPWRVALSTIAIFLLSQLVAAFVVGIGSAIANPGQNATDAFNNSNAAQFFFILVAEGLAVFLVYWLLKRRRLGWSSIGLGRWPGWQDLKWAAGGAVGFYILVIAGSIILSLFVSNNELNKQQDLGFNNLTTFLDHAMAFVSLVILPPLGEETLVRGYLYSGLRKSLRFWPALLITSFLFGLAHLNGGAGGSEVIAAAFDTFILSVVLVYIRERSGALYAGMLVHSLNNLVAFGVHFK